jgi:hypothetical protein
MGFRRGLGNAKEPPCHHCHSAGASLEKVEPEVAGDG